MYSLSCLRKKCADRVSTGHICEVRLEVVVLGIVVLFNVSLIIVLARDDHGLNVMSFWFG